MSIDLSKDAGEPTAPDSTESEAHDLTAPQTQRRTAAEVRAGGPPTAVTVGAALLAVVALLGAFWFGTGWVRAALFTDGPRAAARDTALADARQAAINLLSLDPDDVDGSIRLIQSSMTGSLLDDATKTQEQFREQAKQANTRLESKVLGSALSALNSERDHASALIVLQVTRTAPDTAPYAYRQSWAFDLVKQGDVWKAERASPLGQPIPMNQPDGAQPDGAQSGGSQSGGSQPGGSQPGGSESGGSQPGPAAPEGATTPAPGS